MVQPVVSMDEKNHKNTVNSYKNSSSSLKVLVGGATGLVGQELVAELAQNDHISEIWLVSRRAVEQAPFNSSKVKWLILPPEEWGSYLWTGPKLDAAFCALGTTIKTAGSKEAFYKVDHDLVVDFFKIAQKAGATAWGLVSAIGANLHSTVFYYRVKGETERDVKALAQENKLPEPVFVRPSLLLGDRKESRFLEQLSVKFYERNPWISKVWPESLLAYKPIFAKDVAKELIKKTLI